MFLEEVQLKQIATCFQSGVTGAGQGTAVITHKHKRCSGFTQYMVSKMGQEECVMQVQEPGCVRGCGVQMRGMAQRRGRAVIRNLSV